MTADYTTSLATSGIPEHMHDGIVMYLTHGYQPGSFLAAVISNDLAEAVGRADDKNVRALPEYVRWFWNHAPAPSWGTPSKMLSWMRTHQERRDNERAERGGE